jgi:hypothetical protein
MWIPNARDFAGRDAEQVITSLAGPHLPSSSRPETQMDRPLIDRRRKSSLSYFAYNATILRYTAEGSAVGRLSHRQMHGETAGTTTPPPVRLPIGPVERRHSPTNIVRRRTPHYGKNCRKTWLRRRGELIGGGPKRPSVLQAFQGSKLQELSLHSPRESLIVYRRVKIFRNLF